MARFQPGKEAPSKKVLKRQKRNVIWHVGYRYSNRTYSWYTVGQSTVVLRYHFQVISAIRNYVYRCSGSKYIIYNMALASTTWEKNGRRGWSPCSVEGRKNATRGKSFLRSWKLASAVIHDCVNFENRVSEKLTFGGSWDLKLCSFCLQYMCRYCAKRQAFIFYGLSAVTF